MRARLCCVGGQSLWPAEWADDVAATYLTLRLETAALHGRVREVVEFEFAVLGVAIMTETAFVSRSRSRGRGAGLIGSLFRPHSHGAADSMDSALEASADDFLQSPLARARDAGVAIPAVAAHQGRVRAAMIRDADPRRVGCGRVRPEGTGRAQSLPPIRLQPLFGFRAAAVDLATTEGCVTGGPGCRFR